MGLYFLPFDAVDVDAEVAGAALPAAGAGAALPAGAGAPFLLSVFGIGMMMYLSSGSRRMTSVSTVEVVYSVAEWKMWLLPRSMCGSFHFRGRRDGIGEKRLPAIRGWPMACRDSMRGEMARIDGRLLHEPWLDA